MRRIVITVASSLVVLVALATPAAAHTVSGADPTNWLTRLTAVEPAVPGIEVRIIERGNRVELRNTGSAEAVVLGYQDEPYLRIGPDGVFENRRSPATYLNRDRQATTAVPGDADPEADPEWRKVSSGHVARWHDHRVHWMGDQNPPEVRRAPGDRHVVIPEWRVPFMVGDTSVAATGELVWVPGPSPMPWLALAVASFALVVALARTRRWRMAVALALAVLVGIDLFHAVGVALEATGSVGGRLGELLSGSYVSIVGWIAGIAGVVLLVRQPERDDGLYAAAFAGIFVAVNGGLADVADLTRSQVPFGAPANVARLAVALTLGLGFGLLVAAAWRVLAAPGPADATVATAGADRVDAVDAVDGFDGA